MPWSKGSSQYLGGALMRPMYEGPTETPASLVGTDPEADTGTPDKDGPVLGRSATWRLLEDRAATTPSGSLLLPAAVLLQESQNLAAKGLISPNAISWWLFQAASGS